MLRTVEKAARRLGLEGRAVVVAASGGVDSTVLLHALARLAPRLRLGLAAVHVHHGLRGAEADADAEAVAAQAAALGVRFHGVRVAPRSLRAAGPSRARPTLQEACRRLRYDALFAVAAAHGGAVVATAHTADDQAETVLLRLLRGSAGDGLAGIPERSPDGRVVRPLLAVSREEILGWAQAQGLRWREDASNRSPAYARSRLRTRWLPGLARDFNPGLLRALGRLAEAQRRDAAWMEALVDEEARRRLRCEGGAVWIDAAGFDALADALALRLARRALRAAGAARDVSNRHLTRIVHFLRHARTGRTLELPGRLALARQGPAFRLGARDEAPEGSGRRARSGSRPGSGEGAPGALGVHSEVGC